LIGDLKLGEGFTASLFSEERQAVGVSGNKIPELQAD
jgi:hypothetical protein